MGGLWSIGKDRDVHTEHKELADVQASHGWGLGLPGFTLATDSFWAGCSSEHRDLAPRFPNCPTAHLKLIRRDSFLGSSPQLSYRKLVDTS